MKTGYRWVSLIIVLCLFGGTVSLFADTGSINIGQNTGMEEVLRQNIGKVVEVILDSGVRLKGVIAKVTPNLVHITQITGMEFFDAVIRTDSIDSVLVRMRE